MKKGTMVFSIAFAISATAVAQTNEESNADKAAAVQSQTPARIAVINPETGKLISTPVEQQVGVFGQPQSKSINLSGVASEPQLMPDGSRKIDFNGQFMTPVRAEIDSNGDIETGHHLESELKHNKDQ